MTDKTTSIMVKATELEIKIVGMLSDDYTVAQVAEITGINKRTLDGKIASIKAKYSLKSIAGLCGFFYRNGWIK